jgi:hypothetical protein
MGISMLKRFQLNRVFKWQIAIFHSSLFVLFLFFFSCSNSTEKNKEVVSIDSSKVNVDTVSNSTPSKTFFTGDDSLVTYNDSLFKVWSPKWIRISAGDFNNYKSKLSSSCSLDSLNFISGTNLKIVHHCNEICEPYLAEVNSNRKFLLPCNYDGGVGGVVFSPDCNQVLVFSSYDGSDYVDYYEYRSEIYIFSLQNTTNLNGIKPALAFAEKRWSIEEVVWLNNHSVALKVFSNDRRGDGSNLKFQYLKAEVGN